MKNNYYTDVFFDDLIDSLKSAKVIIPILLQQISPKSVIDIGCGSGEFLQVFKENGISDVFGIEGPWLRKDRLRISKKQFKHADLKKKFSMDRKFDLAVSLEVAEHLPEKSAKTFVECLTKLAPIILFSAAVPLQGGVQHQNEQWPEYWANLFKENGYIPVDSLRKKIWNEPDVCVWYKQNILLFVKKSYLKNLEVLKNEYKMVPFESLSIVHPDLFISKVGPLESIKKRIPHWMLPIISKII